MCATGGLTQKQSLRGLLLRHLNERSWGRELSFCHVGRVIFLWRMIGIKTPEDDVLRMRHLARKVHYLYVEVEPRVFRSVSWSRSGLENHGGYSSRIKSFEDPNGWISN